MADSLERHLEAARQHERAAARHDRSAHYWAEQGDAKRARLQRRFAAHEREGGELERQWASPGPGEDHAKPRDR